jgi:hypothetical protein
MHSNYEAVDQANVKLLQQLRKKGAGDAEEISKSYNELIKNKFIIPLEDLPKEQYDHISKSKVRNYIPNAVAYKSDSHSTKVRICWDATRLTGKGSPLNSQLMRGTSTYSMTKSLLMFDGENLLYHVTLANFTIVWCLIRRTITFICHFGDQI